MKRQTTTTVFLLLLLMAAGASAQNVAGFWLGVTYPTNPNQAAYNYTMTIVQTGTTISGTAQTANPNVPFGGVAYLSGQFTNPTFRFREADAQGRTDTPDVCYWRGNLTYNPTEESLTGQYENIPNPNASKCAREPGGQVELYRIVLKSGTKYCKGVFINLIVTGKAIRWYASADKSKLLATGNTYSPQLTQTTTFYITQTLYQHESPAVPITVEVVEPTLQTTVTNAACGRANGSITAAPPTATNWQYSLNGGAYQPAPSFGNLSPGTYTLAAKDATGCQAERSVTVASDAGPTITDLKITPPRCGTANGEVRIVAGGVATPLTYALDGQARPTGYQSGAVFGNLPDGTFTARVRDARGCEASRPVTLPASKSLVLLSTDAAATTCGQANGRATMAVAGGHQPVQYSLNTQPFGPKSAFDGLAAGTYTVVARDSAGCTLSQSVMVAASTGPTISDVRVTAEGCDQQNGSLTVVAGHPASPLDFSLDGRAFGRSSAYLGLKAGTYTLTVRDNQDCVVSRTVAVPADCAPLVYLPTAFSPNADNVNDALTATFRFPSLTVARFTVYDRWGEVVYNRANFALAAGDPVWDGQAHGRPLPAGTYLYRLDCQFPDGTQTTYRQSVALLY